MSKRKIQVKLNGKWHDTVAIDSRKNSVYECKGITQLDQVDQIRLVDDSEEEWDCCHNGCGIGKCKYPSKPDLGQCKHNQDCDAYICPDCKERIPAVFGEVKTAKIDELEPSHRLDGWRTAECKIIIKINEVIRYINAKP